MAYDVEWSKAALKDVADIIEYISKDSHQNAVRVFEKIQGSVERLSDFPHSGHPTLNPKLQLREVIVFNYRIIYRVTTDSVQIVAVVHGARHLPDALQGRASD